MRHGTKWVWLLVLALVGVGGFLAQTFTAMNVQSYKTVSTEKCGLVKWSGNNSRDRTVWADFKCGDKTITISDAELLAKYLNGGSGKPLTCTFTVGTILGDKYTDCKV